MCLGRVGWRVGEWEEAGGGGESHRSMYPLLLLFTVLSKGKTLRKALI